MALLVTKTDSATQEQRSVHGHACGNHSCACARVFLLGGLSGVGWVEQGMHACVCRVHISHCMGGSKNCGHLLLRLPITHSYHYLCPLPFAAKALAEEHKATYTEASRKASDAIKPCLSLGLPQVGGLPEFEAPVLLEVQAGLPMALHPTLWAPQQ